MKTVNVHKAKTELSKLLAEVEAGEEVVIARRNKAAVKLVPMEVAEKRKPKSRKPGALSHLSTSLPSGFDLFEHAPDDYISKEEIAAYYRKYPREWDEMRRMVDLADDDSKRIRGFGMLAHLPRVPDEFFFDPLPEEELDAWEGGDPSGADKV